jgi:hypothetical protein
MVKIHVKDNVTVNGIPLYKGMRVLSDDEFEKVKVAVWVYDLVEEKVDEKELDEIKKVKSKVKVKSK